MCDNIKDVSASENVHNLRLPFTLMIFLQKRREFRASMIYNKFISFLSYTLIDNKQPKI